MGQVPARYALEAGLEGLTGPSLPEGQEEEGKAQFEQSVKSAKSASKDSEVQRLRIWRNWVVSWAGIERESASKDSEVQRLRIWRNWVVSWAGIEREYKEAMRVFFIRQQRILIGKLKKALASAKSVAKNTDDIIARVVFDLKIENGKIKVINRTFFEKAGELGARQSISEVLGITGEALDEAAEQAKRMRFVKASLIRSSHKITGVNRVTQNMVARQLREGLVADEGLSELTARIKTTLGSNLKRAQRIARTQTAGAVGIGRHAGMKTAGVELKSWLTSGDTNVRDAHVEAGRIYAQGIPLEQPFEVGGEFLQYSADPAGSAANIINCRCVEIARRAAGKSFDLTWYGNLQFYSYSDMQSAQSVRGPALRESKSVANTEEKENGTQNEVLLP